jgi:hypothetical protein
MGEVAIRRRWNVLRSVSEILASAAARANRYHGGYQKSSESRAISTTGCSHCSSQIRETWLGWDMPQDLNWVA